MRVRLARHGETDWNARRWVQGRNDIPLNAAGIAQANRLGDRLAQSSGIVRVYTSPMRRASQTAQIVAERLNVPCEIRPGLEELALGDWEGHTWRQIERTWPEQFRAWTADKRNVRPPDGETYRELLDRLVPAVMRILADAEGDVLIVTHSACILAFLAELNRTPLERMLRDYAAPNAEAIELDSAQILARWPQRCPQ